MHSSPLRNSIGKKLLPPARKLENFEKPFVAGGKMSRFALHNWDNEGSEIW